MAEIERPQSNIVSFPDRKGVPSFAETVSRPNSRPKQLELSLDGERILVAIATDQIHASTFLETLRKFKPSLVVDLRLAPHFRFVAAYENSLLHAITKHGAQYVRRPTPFHEYSENWLRHQPTSVADEILSGVFNSKDVHGPITFLFTHQTDSTAFMPFILGGLVRLDKAGWSSVMVS